MALNTKTLSAGVGDILNIDGGVHATTVRTVVDGDGTSTCLQMNSTKLGIGMSPSKQLDVSGDIGLTGDLYVAQAKKIYFDSTDSYITTNTDNPEDLLIGADADILLEPDNHIGINIGTPSALLTIAETDADAQISLQRKDDSIGSSDIVGSILFAGSDADGSTDIHTGAKIVGVAKETWTSSNFGTELQFFTSDNASSSLAQRMTIDEDGKVGIGDTNPDELLHIESTSAKVAIKLNSASSYDAGLDLYEAGTVKGLFFYDASDNKLRISSGTTEDIEFTTDRNDSETVVMTLKDGTGRVGIGDTSPDEILHLHSTSGATAIKADSITGQDSGYDMYENNTKKGMVFYDASADTLRMATQTTEPIIFSVDRGGSEVEAMTITSTGRVGIGTTSPSDIFSVEGIPSGTDDPLVNFQNSDSSAGSNNGDILRLKFSADAPNDTGSYFIKCHDNSANRFFLYANGTMLSPATYSNDVGATDRAMEVDNSGNIGYQASTRAVKGNIVNMEDISWIYNLTPRNFEYKIRNEDGTRSETLDGIKQYGLIAEEVEEVTGATRLVSYGADGTTPEAVNYKMLSTILLKAIQELKTKVTALENA